MWNDFLSRKVNYFYFIIEMGCDSKKNTDEYQNKPFTRLVVYEYLSAQPYFQNERDNSNYFNLIKLLADLEDTTLSAKSRLTILTLYQKRLYTGRPAQLPNFDLVVNLVEKLQNSPDTTCLTKEQLAFLITNLI
jgi:hypothetical protein